MHLVKLDRYYGPETIAVMTTAFDMVCQSLSARTNANEDVKRTLALAILRLADRGERDPIPVADAAFSELAGSDRSAIGDVRKRVSAWAARRAGGALPL